jgi:hypothetical protein
MLDQSITGLVRVTQNADCILRQQTSSNLFAKKAGDHAAKFPSAECFPNVCI